MKGAIAFRKLHLLSNTHTRNFSSILVDSLLSSQQFQYLQGYMEDFPLYPEILFITVLVIQNRLMICLG